MRTSSTKPRVDYGMDAPGLARGFFVGGSLATLALLPRAFGKWPRRGGGVLAGVLGVAATYLLGMGSVMVYGSRVRKLREREHLLDLHKWNGREHVLDVGCGRGLMLIGAAKRLSDGKAVGIDIWQSEDQADNSPDNALRNAEREGMRERIEIQTADMRELPFGDDSFDVIVSHWTVHNLYKTDERAQALSEMARVLKPGGQIILADIEHQAEYAAAFESLGLTEVEHARQGWQTAFFAAVSFGSFNPTAVVARKPISKLS